MLESVDASRSIIQTPDKTSVRYYLYSVTSTLWPIYANQSQSYCNNAQMTGRTMKVLSFTGGSRMNNSKLCNILEVGSRVALRERLEVFGECSQVGARCYRRPFSELRPLTISKTIVRWWNRNVPGKIVLRNWEYVIRIQKERC